MHFGHPRTITTFKTQNFLKIWVFQGFPYTRLGPDLAILSPFWGKKFQNLCKNMPKSWSKENWNFFIFQKRSKLLQNVFWAFQNHYKPQKTLVSEISSLFQSKWYIRWDYVCRSAEIAHMYLQKFSLKCKNAFFLTKMLFLLRFGCCFCCFSKSREPGDVASYFYFFNTTSS